MFHRYPKNCCHNGVSKPHVALNAAIAVESDEMDWEFILKVQRERIILLRMLDRNPEADEFEAQIQTITEVIE